jgi:hypothetical protein
VFGFLTHLTMSDLVVLWKTSTSSGGRRAGGYKPGEAVAAGCGPQTRSPGEFPRDLAGRRWAGTSGQGQGRAAAARREAQFITPQEQLQVFKPLCLPRCAVRPVMPMYPLNILFVTAWCAVPYACAFGATGASGCTKCTGSSRRFSLWAPS